MTYTLGGGGIILSEFTTQHFFFLALPVLFPHGSGDLHIEISFLCPSIAELAEHLLWHRHGRFPKFHILSMLFIIGLCAKEHLKKAVSLLSKNVVINTLQ